MSISEISAASALPERSRARISATAARALGPGAVRIDASSSSVRPLITGAPGTTARRSSPSTRPSSSIQCSRAACTSVNGRRSSTTIVTRFGSSRTTSARRISGSAETRAATAPPSRVQRFAPGGMAAAARMRGTGTREAPRTSTPAIAKRGDVVTQRAPASAAATPPSTRTQTAARRVSRARARARRRRRAGPVRWPATSDVRSPRSAGAAPPRGESRPLLTEDADLGLERDPEVAVDALARELHEAQDVGRAGAAAIDDEVGVLGRDLRAVDPLAAQAGLLDEPRGQVARGILPDEAGRGLRQVERAVAEGARGLELAERSVRVQEVHGADEIADPAVGGSRIHGQGSTDGGGNADETFDPTQIEGGRFSDQCGETDARAGQRLLAVELRAPEAAL